MKIHIDVALHAMLTVEVPDKKRKTLEDLYCPMDLDYFEQATGIPVDVDDILNSGTIEVVDVDFPRLKPPSKKST